MRIRRLDLARYGKFTDRSIVFGERSGDGPDLHIVYGPNEAGKSTAFSALLDLLYGIEFRSRFNFLHPYSTMRVGGVLELGSGTFELARVRGRQNTLLDAHDRPVSEAILQAELGAIDRDAYRTMFSLDDETLEKGGESILGSKGDLGQLLFSASAGLADLSRRLADLDAEADRFHRANARSGELADLKARLATLKDERDRLDILATEYRRLVAERDDARLHYETALGERARTSVRIDEIRRLLTALPRLASLKTVRGELAGLDGLPDAPAGWARELPRLREELARHSARLETIDGTIANLRGELDGLEHDDAALNVAAQATALAELRARHMTADRDLPERRLSLREVDGTISGILDRIGRGGEGNPGRLVLGAPALGTLRTLIEARSGIDARSRAAEAELSRAERDLAEAEARFRDAAGDDTVAARDGSARDAALRATVTALRADDHAARRRLAERARANRQAALDDALRALKPWHGEPDALINMVVPEAGEIDGWRTGVEDAQREVARREEELDRLRAEAARLKAEIDVIARSAGLVGADEAHRVRVARDEAWTAHRAALDAVTADAFADAMGHDDRIAAARLSHASELAQQRQAERALALAEVDIGRTEGLAAKARASLAAWQDRMAQAIRAFAPGLSADMAPAVLEAWLARRDKALEGLAALREAERDLAEAQADGEAARGRLAGALAASGVAHDPVQDFEAMMAVAEAALDRQTELAALREAIAQGRRKVEERTRDLEQARIAGRDWQRAWDEACAATWLGEGGTVPAVGVVREILVAVADLGPALAKRTNLADRIEKMERDQADFAAEVDRLAGMLDLSAPGGVLDRSAAIEERVKAAEDVRVRRRELGRKLEEAVDTGREIAAALSSHQARSDEITAFLGVDTRNEAETVLRAIERRTELRRQQGDIVRDILDATNLPTLEEAEAVLADVERGALEAERAELDARFEGEDGRVRELFSAHSKAEDRLNAIGGDDAVARIEERRQTTLLEIEDGAHRYLRLRIGAAAAGHALRLYRDRHRSAMMARASEAFRTISRGAYRGLAAQPGKDGEILVAIGADGASKLADELSKGTRFQLYLALRVAGYHEFAETRRPVPFVADDIMETFDDFRAEEAFRLFADMAGVGQVIYLTHHRHLCDIARRVCPQVRIHDLDAGTENPAVLLAEGR